MAEKKYIELQKALNVCEMHYEHCLEMHDWSGDATADNIKRDIETLPTADVVEVVYCSECKYQDDCARRMVHTTRNYILEQNISTYNKVNFCSYGERKE